MTERILTDPPPALPTMLKAALPVLPVVGALPGVRKSGGNTLPDLTVRRTGVRVDPGQVSAYAQLCAFEKAPALPLTYPHLLGFPLQMAILTDGSFPYPAVGLVHLANTIHQHRPIDPGESLDLAVTATNLSGHAKGRTFDLLTTISVADEVVWDSVSTYLRRGRAVEGAENTGEPLPVVASNGVVWTLPGDLGRRYAAVSGDRNPIHLYRLTARAFGFKRQIAHGMWTAARSVAAVATRLPDRVTVEVEFRKPVFLPGRVAFGSRVVEDGIDFSLTDPRSGSAHLAGRSR